MNLRNPVITPATMMTMIVKMTAETKDAIRKKMIVPHLHHRLLLLHHHQKNVNTKGNKNIGTTMTQIMIPTTTTIVTAATEAQDITRNISISKTLLTPTMIPMTIKPKKNTRRDPVAALRNKTVEICLFHTRSEALAQVFANIFYYSRY